MCIFYHYFCLYTVCLCVSLYPLCCVSVLQCVICGLVRHHIWWAKTLWASSIVVLLVLERAKCGKFRRVALTINAERRDLR